jgi:hypothetical protein
VDFSPTTTTCFIHLKVIIAYKIFHLFEYIKTFVGSIDILETKGNILPRYGFTSIFDTNVETLYIFFGYDGDREYNEIWSVTGGDDMPNSTHVPVSVPTKMPSLSPPNQTHPLPAFKNLTLHNETQFPPRSLHSTVYVPGANEVIIFGGRNGDPLNDTWKFDMNLKMVGKPGSEHLANVVSELKPSGRFIPRSGHASVFVDNFNIAVTIGGYDDSRFLSDVVVYNRNSSKTFNY